MSKTITPDLENVLKKDEDTKKEMNEALRLLTLKKDEDNTLDLLTNLTPLDIMYLIKIRLINDIYFKKESMEQAIENLDLNYRALLISLNRSGRKDVKDIYSYESLASILGGGRIEDDQPKGLTQRALDKLKIQR